MQSIGIDLPSIISRSTECTPLTIPTSEPDDRLDGFSVVIPAHNESLLLPKTLKSVRAAAQSTGRDFEVIVVDDDSTDNTSEIALKNGSQVVRVAKRNIAAVRNAGAKQAQYPYLVFLDADTILPEPTLRATLDALDNGMIGGGARVEIDRSDSIPFVKNMMFLAVRIGWQTLGRNAAGCYVFCKKEAFDSFGGFPEEYFAAEEYFVSRNLKRIGRFVILPEHVISSARKLHDYSTWQLARFLIRPFLSKSGPLKSRDGLEVLYKHRSGK